MNELLLTNYYRCADPEVSTGIQVETREESRISPRSVQGSGTDLPLYRLNGKKSGARGSGDRSEFIIFSIQYIRVLRLSFKVEGVAAARQ